MVKIFKAVQTGGDHIARKNNKYLLNLQAHKTYGVCSAARPGGKPYRFKTVLSAHFE
jgi:hypothetical protein